ncbi:Uncharacterised protein [Porphyromonas cangingivalis]|nr:Uncharacterised protein [Porphyromonas cangingivalis]
MGIELLLKTMSKKIFLSLSFFLFVSYSCISIKGLTDGYKSLSKEHKERVVRLASLSTGKFNHIATPDSVYVVSANTLKNIILNSRSEYQLLYEYIPDCPSEICIPIKTFLDICTQYGAEPIILSFYFDNDLFSKSSNDFICYVADSKAYKTKFVYKYSPKFISELTNGAIKENDSWMYNMYLFHKGIFVKTINILRHEEELSEILRVR